MPDQPAKSPAREPDPITTQRWIVYSTVGLLVLAALALSIGFKDACAKYGGEVALAALGQRCKDVVTWQDYLPGSTTVIVLGLVYALNVLAWEARWHVRVIAPAVIGVAYLFVGAGVLLDDRPPVLAVFYLLSGLGMLACVWGIRRERREGWAFALSMVMFIGIAHFFGSATIRSAFDVHLALAVFPSLGVQLPIVIALVTTPPGTPRPTAR